MDYGWIINYFTHEIALKLLGAHEKVRPCEIYRG